MRPGLLALISVLAAVIGAAVALALGSALDWVGPSRTQTVFSQAPGFTLTDEQEPPPRSVARPLEGAGFEPARIYDARAEGVVTIFAYFPETAASGDGGQGSGFVATEDGYVLTAAHVITTAGPAVDPGDVRPAREVFVGFRDGDRVPARIVGWDVFDDVAVLKVDPARHALSPVPLGDSSQVLVGEPVAAIGSPFGAENSLATGIVSATGRTIPTLTSRYSIVDAIQIDAPINRGNSGGPLFDARGRVIGINAQIRSTSGLSEGVGFAVPINSARRSMEDLIARGKVSYAYIGVTTNDLWPALSRELDLEVERGAFLVDVVADGPAAKAGLRGASRTLTFQGQEVRVGGDVVIAVNGQRIDDGSELVRIVTNELRAGTEALFTVLRDGRRVDVPLRPEERPSAPTG
ncbi:MAG: trypsin-like peptidase domain-containing protein [Thermoleophilia bacterium]|nr:trypsin-like peptidase domain-containing protein [Thermoleophilia bacterium]